MSERNTGKFFTRELLQWNEKDNNRQMPWKGEKDPYKIWLSEIILQQTRVEQGLSYYNRFVESFPNVHSLAQASESEVFKLWEGLGYYTRCKNLIATARYISTELKGKFPSTYEGILALKGIGPYTAAAIGSFAFNMPKAVLDGNVFRVLSRFFGIASAIDSVTGKKDFSALAESLLDKANPGVYNQAIMDFGAVICKPQLPLCDQCILQKNCVAFIEKKVNLFPVKEKSMAKKTRWFYYVVAAYGGKQYIRMRIEKDIWQNLYEFILLEAKGPVDIKVFLSERLGELLGPKYAIRSVSGIYRQQLTHQTICGQFVHVKLQKPLTGNDYLMVGKEEMARLPFPKFINQYLQDKTVSLNLF